MKKKFKELKDNQKVLALFGILGLVLLLTAGTYAFFSYSKEGTTENTLKSGSITFWYDEINQSGNSISIEDALPMSDEAGKQQTAAFNFKIQSTTSSTNTIPYEITLRQKQGTDNIGDIVKVYLAKTSAVDASIASEEEVELSLFSELSNVTKNTYSEKLLHTDIVPASDTPYTQFYRLKMWIDNNTDYSQVENETTHEMEYPYNNKTFTVTVNVYANGHVIDATSSQANVSNVSVGGTELTPVSTNYYEATLPEGTHNTTITVDTENPYSSVNITKTQSDYTTPVAVNDNIQKLSTSKQVTLTDGANYFKAVITPEQGNATQELHIKVVSGHEPFAHVTYTIQGQNYEYNVLEGHNILSEIEHPEIANYTFVGFKTENVADENVLSSLTSVAEDEVRLYAIYSQTSTYTGSGSCSVNNKQSGFGTSYCTSNVNRPVNKVTVTAISTSPSYCSCSSNSACFPTGGDRPGCNSSIQISGNGYQNPNQVTISVHYTFSTNISDTLTWRVSFTYTSNTVTYSIK